MSDDDDDDARLSRPVVFVIDVEPDDRKTMAGQSGWESSEAAYDRLEHLRSSLESATGRPVRYNWFLRCDPQIERTFGRADFVAAACPRIVRRAVEGGDSAGIHVHLWRWSDARGTWYNDLDDRAWIEECVSTSREAFAKIVGHGPLMSRFGDRWLSEVAVEVLRESGIRLDLTMEPGLPGERIHDDRHATSTLPDFRGAPREPYRPVSGSYMTPRRDEARPGDFWMLPLTTTMPKLRPVRRPPWLMRASRSPNLALDFAYVWPHLRNELDVPSTKPLVMVFRSGDLATPRFAANFERTTRELVRHPALPWCDFTTPADAIEGWTASPT